MPNKSNEIVRSEVEPINGQNSALLTLVFGDGFDATARISHAAATELVKQLQAFTNRKVV